MPAPAWRSTAARSVGDGVVTSAGRFRCRIRARAMPAILPTIERNCMSLTGPAPKDPDQRRRRNKPAEFEELPAEGYQGDYPPLPGAYRTGDIDPDTGEAAMREYLPDTRRWFDAWARSPMAVRFTGVDWLRLQQLAPLVDAYTRAPSRELAAELRLQQSNFGGSPVDRQRMRVRIANSDTAAGSPAARRRREDPRLRVVEP